MSTPHGVTMEWPLGSLVQAVDRLAHPEAWQAGLEDIGAGMETLVRRRFETGVGPDGTPWPPSLRAIEEHGQTLVDTARLLSSITNRVDTDEVAVGTNVIYAGIHQFGGNIVPKTARALIFRIGERLVMTQKVSMPARPFVGMGPDEERLVTETIHDIMRGLLQ